jgi:hypothetical protein
MKRYLTIFTAAMGLLLLVACAPEKKQSNLSRLIVDSEPQKADIFLNSENMKKQTPTSLNLNPGNYLVKVSKDGYLPEWRYVKVPAKKEITADFKLQPVKGAVLIETKPVGAEVVMNGEKQGVTPLILTELKCGEYSAELQMVNRAPRSIKWEIKSARPKKVIASLESNVGKVVLNTNPEKARVYIDGKACGFTPYTAEIQEGKHDIKFSLSGFSEVTTPINVLREQETVKSVDLVRLPGSFKFLSTPEGAKVYINDKAYGKTPLQVDDLPQTDKKYRIRVDKSGFDSITREANITAGRVNTVEFVMKRNTGGIDFIVNPPGVTVYLNGKKYCMSEEGESKELSKMIQIRSLPAGNYLITLAHKRMMPPKKSYRVKVDKAKITRLEPINVWVANAVLKIRNEPQKTILLLSHDKNHITYSPEPGVKIKIPKEEMLKVEFVRPLTEADE